MHATIGRGAVADDGTDVRLGLEGVESGSSPGATMEVDRRLLFDDFSLDLSTEQLSCGGEVVPSPRRRSRSCAGWSKTAGRWSRKRSCCAPGGPRPTSATACSRSSSWRSAARSATIRRRRASSRRCRAGDTASSPGAAVRQASPAARRAAHWSAATGCSPSSRIDSRARKPASARSCFSPARPASGRPRCSMHFGRAPRLIRTCWSRTVRAWSTMGRRKRICPFSRRLGDCCASRVPSGWSALFKTHAPTWLAQLPWLEDGASANALAARGCSGSPRSGCCVRWRKPSRP